MQTAKLSTSGVPSYNYGMAVLEKNILKNSKISAFLINKQSLFNDKCQEYAHDLSDFNRVFGFESKLQSQIIQNLNLNYIIINLKKIILTLEQIHMVQMLLMKKEILRLIYIFMV